MSNALAHAEYITSFFNASMYFLFLVTTNAAISTKMAMTINVKRIRNINNLKRPL